MTNGKQWGWIELYQNADVNGYNIVSPKHQAVVPQNVEHNGQPLNGEYYVNVYVERNCSH